jgi:sec-independent protein translocase protein TatA
MMDGLHWLDLLVLLGMGLLIFGPRRLPQVGATLGAMLRDLRQALHEPPAPDSDHDQTSDTADGAREPNY